jgi:hypothetical protein
MVVTVAFSIFNNFREFAFARSDSLTASSACTMITVRVSFSTLLAAILLTLSVGIQVLEATGRWDRTFQDSGDEAVIVAVVLCIGSALAAARVARQRLSPTLSKCGIALVPAIAIPIARTTVSPGISTSPPVSLRI